MARMGRETRKKFGHAVRMVGVVRVVRKAAIRG
jgi:hypothetical protein